MTQAHIALLIALLCALACACQPPDDHQTPASSTRQARDLPPLDVLQDDLRSFDPERMRNPLAQLAWATELPLERNPLRHLHRRLLADTAIDLWLYTRIASTLAETTADHDVRQRWLDEHKTFAELLELFVTPDANHLDATDPLGAALAARLEPWLRPALRDPLHANTARTQLDLLEVARATEPRLALRAATRLARPHDAPLALHANLFLALRATPLLDALPARAAYDPELHAALARATGQTCPELLVALEDAHGPAHAAELLRRRCAFACTDTDPLLGLTTPAPLPPLTHDLEDHCPLPTLPPDTPGRHQAFANALTTTALTELARLRDTLRATDTLADDELPLLRVARPFIEAFAARVDAAIVPGHLPFLTAQSADGLRLPAQRRASAPLVPTPAIAVISGRQLALAAWPRYAAHTPHAARSLVTDPELAFPPPPLVNLAAPTVTDHERIKLQLQRIDQLPWPVHPTRSPDEPTVTLVADARTRVDHLRRAARLLADAGFVRIVIATWPADDEGALNQPTPAGLLVRIDTPIHPAPTLRLADHRTFLLDTLGRPRELPIFQVRRFIPDIYDAVLAFTRANPAITELVLDPAPELDLDTLAMTLDALQYQRDGDVMASTEHLLAAPPIETPFAPRLPLVRPIYLAP